MSLFDKEGFYKFISFLNGVNYAGFWKFKFRMTKMDLKNSNLSGIDFGFPYLGSAFISWILWGAMTQGLNISGTILKGTNLKRTNLMLADLTDADLTCSDLSGANLTDTNLTNANLTSTNLTYVKGLELNQLKKAKVDRDTILPNDLKKELERE